MAIPRPSLVQLASGLDEDTQKALAAVLRGQDDFNQRVAQAIANMQPGPWVRPQYLNAWVDAGGTPARFVEYRTERWSEGELVVRVQGRMKDGVVGSPAFILPQELWPSQDLFFAVASNSLFGRAQVFATTGVVQLTNGSNASADMNFTFAVA